MLVLCLLSFLPRHFSHNPSSTEFKKKPYIALVNIDKEKIGNFYSLKALFGKKSYILYFRKESFISWKDKELIPAIPIAFFQKLIIFIRNFWYPLICFSKCPYFLSNYWKILFTLVTILAYMIIYYKTHFGLFCRFLSKMKEYKVWLNLKCLNIYRKYNKIYKMNWHVFFWVFIHINYIF